MVPVASQTTEKEVNRMKRFPWLLFVAVIGLSLLTAGGPSRSSAAEPFPSKDINFIIPTSVGGGNDLLTRALIPGMEKALKVKCRVEYVQGANGGVAAVKVGSMKPDGYTIFLHSQSVVMMQYTGQPQLNAKRLALVAQVAEDKSALSVPVDSPYKSLKDIVEAARKRPETIKVGTTATGSIFHIALTLLEEAAGVKFKFVPYSKGGANAAAAAAAKEVDAVLVGPAESRALIDSGKIRPIAILNKQRDELYRDVPTAMEQGYNVAFPIWRAVWTTAGVPEERMDILSDAIQKAMKDEAFKNYVKTSGVPPHFVGHRELRGFLDKQNKLYRDFFEKAGLKTSEPK
jgi:tripartite-type tricarboxylate transporter receptor subunit TctC